MTDRPCVIGVDLAGLSGKAAKTVAAWFQPREDGGFDLTKLEKLDRADQSLRPDHKFLNSVPDDAVLAVDSPLQWPALLNQDGKTDVVERIWHERLKLALPKKTPFSLVRDRLCERCMQVNRVPVNNPGVNLGGVVARAIYWRQQLSPRVTVIEANPDSVLACVCLATRLENHLYYRVKECLRGKVTLQELFSLKKIRKHWGSINIGSDFEGRDTYTFCNKVGGADRHTEKDYLMAIAAGLCGISYVRNQVLLPCTAKSKSDLGEPFATDGWMYLPVGGRSYPCNKCLDSRSPTKAAALFR